MRDIYRREREREMDASRGGKKETETVCMGGGDGERFGVGD